MKMKKSFALLLCIMLLFGSMVNGSVVVAAEAASQPAKVLSENGGDQAAEQGEEVIPSEAEMYTAALPAPAEPTVELRMPGDTLSKDEIFEVEIWLYNVSDVQSALICLNDESNASLYSVSNDTVITSGSFSEAVSLQGGFTLKGANIVALPAVLKCWQLKFDVNSSLTVGAGGQEIGTITLQMKASDKPNLNFKSVNTGKSECHLYISKNGSGSNGKYNSVGSTPNLEKRIERITVDPDNPGTAPDAYWPSFRGNENNMGITNAPTPVSGEKTALKWALKKGSGWNDAVGPPIIANDALYMADPKKLFKIDMDTGNVLGSADLEGNTGFNTVSPAYGVITEGGIQKGVIFVSQTGGVIEAIDASTLESRWVYENEAAGQNNCPVTYDDGYVYTGFWNSEEGDANFVCVSASDGNLEWEYTHKGGFYWAGAIVAGDAVIVGSDDGQPDMINPSKLYAFDKLTGELLDSETIIGDQRSSIAYDRESGKHYFTTKAGYLYSVAFDDDEFEELQGVQYKNAGGTQALESTSTPVVHNGRVYFGLGRLNQNSCFVVADADTLEEIYRIPMIGYPQSSALLSTAYESTEGYSYLYCTYNYPPGGVTLIKDKPGQTTAVYEELFQPNSGMTQYCLSSVICDENGALYYINDTGTFFALKKDVAYLTGLSVNGGSTELNRPFAPGHTEYTAMAPPGSTSVTVEFAAVTDASVRINSAAATSPYPLNLIDGTGSITITVSKDSDTRNYTLDVTEESVDASAAFLGISKSATAYTNGRDNPEYTVLRPGFSSNTTDYDSQAVGGNNNALYFFVSPTSSRAAVEAYPVDATHFKIAPGFTKLVTNGAIEINTGMRRSVQEDSGSGTRKTVWYWPYHIHFAEGYNDARVRIVITAGDGETTEEYYLTLRRDITKPTLAAGTAARTSASAGTLGFTSDEAGEYAYVIKESGAAIPVNAEFIGWQSCVQGQNEIRLQGLTDGNEKDVYLRVRDNAYGANYSTILKFVLPAYSGGGEGPPIKGDFQVSFRLIGATRSSGDIDLKDGNYKGSKYITWIATQKYTMKEGDTVYDLYTQALAAAGLNSNGASGNYVRTIEAPDILGGYKISEFTNGGRSGWMYSIDGSHPSEGLMKWPLESGDKVIWHYVNDYSYEVTDWDKLGGSGFPQLGDGRYWNKWLEAEDISPEEYVAKYGAPAQESEDSGAIVSKIEVNARTSTDGKAAASVETAIPTSSVKEAAKSDNLILTVATPVGKVSFDQKALSAISAEASGSDIKLNVGKADRSKLSEAQQQAVADRPVFELNLTSGGRTITDFNGGKASVSLPYTLAVGEEAANLCIFYVDGKGELIKVEGASYNEKTDLVTFPADHFSYYAISYQAEDKFTDVKSGSWFYENIMYLAGKGILKGKTETAFAPGADITRAEFVQILYGMAQAEAMTSGSAVTSGSITSDGTKAAVAFQDVKATDWYAKAVAWAYESGVATGMKNKDGASDFAPGAGISRQDMAVMIKNYSEKVTKKAIAGTVPAVAFEDGPDIAAYAKEAVALMQQGGIINGVSKKNGSGEEVTAFAPKNSATRAEAATMIAKLLKAK
ncbi:MAG TPA: S-layer homology domain-containing protein [Anaerovoracaceae bacterium]|nr:S-layer homology domain-containing protein [Anaerovoracaceae bacterium]